MISKNPRFRPNSVKIFRVPPLRIFYPCQWGPKIWKRSPWGPRSPNGDPRGSSVCVIFHQTQALSWLMFLSDTDPVTIGVEDFITYLLYITLHYITLHYIAKHWFALHKSSYFYFNTRHRSLITQRQNMQCTCREACMFAVMYNVHGKPIQVKPIQFQFWVFWSQMALIEQWNPGDVLYWKQERCHEKCSLILSRNIETQESKI